MSRNCDICLNLDVSAGLSRFLKDFRHGAFHGCRSCKLLADCTNLFESRWAHLDANVANQVHLVLSGSIFFSDKALDISLKWPSGALDGWEELKIEITSEVSSNFDQR